MSNKPFSNILSSVKQKQTLITVGIVIIVFGGIILGLYLTEPKQQPHSDNKVGKGDEVTEHFSLPGQQVDPREMWISRGEADINALKQSNTEFMQTIEELRSEVETLREEQMRGNRTASMQRYTNQSTRGPATFPMIPQTAPINPGGQNNIIMDNAISNASVSTARNPGGQPPRSQPALQPNILSVSLSDKPVTPATGKDQGLTEKECNITNCIPPGAFAKAALLSGLDAPTGGHADTNPHPVLLELMDTASLPNSFRSRVKECRVVASGFGRISDERAYLRLERLSCVLRDGEIVDVALKGYISGEDGKVGMRGHLISKQGALIARALLAGTAGGIGKAVSQSYNSVLTSPTGSVTSIDPNRTLEYGVASGFGTALEKISDWYLKRADETYPIIEIDAGRVVEVVLTEGVKLGVNMEENHS